MKMKKKNILLNLVIVLVLTACNLPIGASTSEPQIDTDPTDVPITSNGGNISGVVWHDLCAFAGGPAPAVLPPGCVPHPSNGASANGTREAGESGISGVLVDLHLGDCVSIPISSFTTDSNGQFIFSNLTDDAYCVTIDGSSPQNSVVLQPGIWTKPTSPTYFIQLADKISGGDTLVFDIGWDFKNQPAVNAPLPTFAPATTSTPAGTYFVVDTGANCRFGPATLYDVITSFEAGTFVTLVGRNTDNTWWYVLTGSTNCWISATTGHTTGALGALPVITAPPTPTPAAGAGPTFSGLIVVYPNLDYPSTNCGANIFNVAIRVADTDLNTVWLQYRVRSNGGYVGIWNVLTPNDNASGGLMGFNYDLNAQFAGELGGDDGTVEYQFFAEDTAGNQTSHPNGSVLGIPLQYCP